MATIKEYLSGVRMVCRIYGNDRIAAQLQLERYLGLRTEESCKFNGHQALLADGRVFIQHGTKGGRERMLNEVTANGREAIRYVRLISGRGNLIPSSHSLKTWMQKYYRVIRAKGISKKACGASSHGCRHAYTQERYEMLTGFKAPCKFETKAKFRKNAERIAGRNWRKLNRDARYIIKAELGHGPDRDDVVSQYLGAM